MADLWAMKYRKIFFLMAIFLQMETTPLLLGKEAHIHGEGYLRLTYHHPEGEWSLRLPADLVVGFEHTPRNASQKKQWDERLRAFDMDLENLIKIPPFCGAKDKHSIELVTTQSHAEIVVTQKFNCKDSNDRRTIKFHFFSHFKKLNKVLVTIVTPNSTKNEQFRYDSEIDF
ncbi:MAG: DUF2796 domain-containing protein [Bdellovibrionaceae bacterium]|nr:DUF2796 domain-containing protein [Pseudobdellovibrionaceae bacterium]